MRKLGASPNRKQSTTIHLEPLMLARLARLSSATNKPQAAYVREAIEVMLLYEEQRNADRLANWDIVQDMEKDSEERE